MDTMEKNTGDVLSEQIKKYKVSTETVTVKGMVEEDKEKNIVRVVLETPSGFPPVYADINEADVVLIAPHEPGESTAVQLKRGTDFVLSVVAVAGLEENLTLNVGDILRGDFEGSNSGSKLG
jgi:hypothetical protein